MKLILAVDSMSMVIWWVDSSSQILQRAYRVYGLPRQGISSEFQKKEKIIVRRSTEIELLGAYKLMPNILRVDFL